MLAEELGIVPGNRVLLRGPNNPWLAACWFGVLKAGAVAVTTMPLLRAGELSTIARDRPGRPGAVRPPVRRRPAGRRPGRRAGGRVRRRPARRPDPAGGGAAGATFAAVDTAADDVALLAFTSGTTGRPKATMHFHRDVLAIADTFSAHVLRPTADDVFTGTPPLAFTFGLGGLLVFPLRAGAATLLVEKATPGRAGRRRSPSTA